jgi:arylsulfatase A-like enzyme
MDGTASKLARWVAVGAILAMLVPRVDVAAAPASTGAEGSDRRPNILIVLVDDMRAPGTMKVLRFVRRWFGRQGRTFKEALDTTPLCCPSRASLFTGQYAHNTGVIDNTHAGLQRFDQHTSIARYLQESGYRTGFAGKLFNFWHVEDDPLYFDRWSVYHPTNVRNGYFDMKWNQNGSLKQVHTYSTDFIADQGAKFIRSSEANDDKPWFLELATYAPHLGPGPEPTYAKDRVGPLPMTPAMTERDRSDKPPFVRADHATLEDGRKAREGQLRMLMSVDDLVAKVAATLRQTGETRDTLAFFVSDNGYLWGEHGVTAKGTAYSAGVHVPLLARWPGHIQAGTFDGRIVAILDIAPTILDAAGIEQDADEPMDGRSLLDRSWTRPRLLLEYWRWNGSTAPPWASTWSRHYQYTEYYDAGEITFREYYDLDHDPWQLVNLLKDGRSGNDPDIGPLHDLLTADRSCVGTECP